MKVKLLPPSAVDIDFSLSSSIFNCYRKKMHLSETKMQKQYA